MNSNFYLTLEYPENENIGNIGKEMAKEALEEFEKIAIKVFSES